MFSCITLTTQGVERQSDKPNDFIGFLLFFSFFLARLLLACSALSLSFTLPILVRLNLQDIWILHQGPLCMYELKLKVGYEIKMDVFKKKLRLWWRMWLDSGRRDRMILTDGVTWQPQPHSLSFFLLNFPFLFFISFLFFYYRSRHSRTALLLHNNIIQVSPHWPRAWPFAFACELLAHGLHLIFIRFFVV